jgi:hypothetical protein
MTTVNTDGVRWNTQYLSGRATAKRIQHMNMDIKLRRCKHKQQELAEPKPPGTAFLKMGLNIRLQQKFRQAELQHIQYIKCVYVRRKTM